MFNAGDFSPGKIVRGYFPTHLADGTPITYGGTPAAAAYKDDSTAESTTGVTLSIDYDSRTGLQKWKVDTSSDGTFYSAGSDFCVVLTGGTVNGIAVNGFPVGHFSISNRSALRPSTADQALSVDGSGRTLLQPAQPALTLTSLTITGAFLVSGGTTYTNSVGSGFVTSATGGNGHGWDSTGNGTGHGDRSTGGVNGDGSRKIGGATTGNGMVLLSPTSGNALNLTSTTGNSLDISAGTSGHGIRVLANGTSKHGISVLGGSAGTSDGASFMAGVGGVDLRANITGNLVGTVSTVTTLSNLPAMPANWLNAAGINPGALNGKGDWPLASSMPANFATLLIDTNGRVKSQAALQKNIAFAGFEFMMTDSTSHNPATGKTVTCMRSIDKSAFATGTLANIVEVGNGFYAVDFGAGDLNGGNVTLRAMAAGCDDTDVTLYPTP